MGEYRTGCYLELRHNASCPPRAWSVVSTPTSIPGVSLLGGTTLAVGLSIMASRADSSDLHTCGSVLFMGQLCSFDEGLVKRESLMASWELCLRCLSRYTGLSSIASNSFNLLQESARRLLAERVRPYDYALRCSMLTSRIDPGRQIRSTSPCRAGCGQHHLKLARAQARRPRIRGSISGTRYCLYWLRGSPRSPQAQSQPRGAVATSRMTVCKKSYGVQMTLQAWAGGLLCRTCRR